MKRILNYSKIFLLATLIGVTGGCVKYDNFVITEKPYVDKTSVELYVGDQAGEHSRIQLTSSPEGKQFTWTSLDPQVATVTQNGLITALQEGFAIITVSSGNDESRVNVWVRNWVPFEDFSLNKQKVELKRLGRTQVVATPIPQDASIVDVVWTSSNPEIAEVFDNGWIVGHEIGNAVITARAAGKEIKLDVEVSVDIIKFPRTKWTVPGYEPSSQAPQIGYSSQQAAYPIMNLFDGIVTSFWHGAYSGANSPSNYPHWFIVDMHTTNTVVEVMLQRRQTFVSANGFYLYTCPDVQVDQSDPVNGYPWEYQGEYAFNPTTDAEQRFALPNRTDARYIKMYFDVNHKTPNAPNNYIQMAEFAAYGY